MATLTTAAVDALRLAHDHAVREAQDSAGYLARMRDTVAQAERAHEETIARLNGLAATLAEHQREVNGPIEQPLHGRR